MKIRCAACGDELLLTILYPSLTVVVLNAEPVRINGEAASFAPFIAFGVETLREAGLEIPTEAELFLFHKPHCRARSDSEPKDLFTKETK